MTLNKTANYKMKKTAYSQPVSNLKVSFYNLDENTATLQFQIYDYHGPLLLGDRNVVVYGYFESENKSASSELDLDIVDGLNGIVQVTLEKEFLQASTSTKVNGQLYIGLKNASDKKEYDQTVVLGEFNFYVVDALINKVSSFTKVEYIQMFDKLRDEIKKRTKEIENDIGNIKTFVNEVKGAVTEGKADITKIKNDSIGELETIANTTNASVQQQANQAISEIQSIVDEYTTKLNDETEDKINQVNEASDKVLESVKQNNVVTTEETENWQKYKLTENTGVPFYERIDDDEQKLHELDYGFYYCIGVPIDEGQTTKSGFVTVKIDGKQKSVKHIYFTPYNSSQIFLKRYYNSWGEWERVNDLLSDTGWISITIKNGYNESSRTGFEPSYRVIDYSTHKKVFIRFGVENIKDGTNTVGNIPLEINPYKIYGNGTTTTAKIPPKIAILNGEIVIYTNLEDSYSENDYIFYQTEWII